MFCRSRYCLGCVGYKENLAADETNIVESTIVAPSTLVIFNTCFQTANTFGALDTPFTPITFIFAVPHEDFAVGAAELDVVGSGVIVDRFIGRDGGNLQFESAHEMRAQARKP